MENNKVKLKKFGDSGTALISVMSFFSLFVFWAINKSVNQNILDQQENMYYNLMNRNEFEEFKKT